MTKANRTLVSPAALTTHLNNPDWVIIDCRHDLGQPELGRKLYQAGHIPGARFLHVDDDLSGPKTGSNGRHPLPEREVLAARLRATGVKTDSQVIAYDASGGMYAARLWWLMNWLGHEQVAVLDGGLPAWLAHGERVSGDLPQVVPGNFTSAAPLVSVADADVVLANLTCKARLVVDGRGPERYRGDVEPIDPVAGHIPEALNRFFMLNVDADGRFKPDTVLRREFEELLGQVKPADTIQYCGSGVSACHNILAMEIAGLHGTALYAGSWSEWSSDPSRPVAKG